MAGEKKKRKFTIFLIKESYAKDEKYLQNMDQCDEQRKVVISGTKKAILYLGKTYLKPPDWHEIFRDVVDWNKYRSSSVKGLLILKLTKKRIFGLTFGYGKSFLNPSAIESNFGFRVVINSVDPESLKSIEKKSIIENPLLSREQITKSTDLSQFNVDTFTDILSKLRGRSKVNDFGISVDGKDSLSLNVRTELKDLPSLLKKCYVYYSSEAYKKYFPEIDNIIEVRDKDKLSTLNEQLITWINVRDYEYIWTSIPEFHDEEDFDCYQYSCDRSKSKRRFYDIELKDYINTKKGKSKRDPVFNIDTLKRDRVGIKNVSDYVDDRWRLLDCLYTEVSIEGNIYIFYGGKWYLISEKFVEKINKQFLSVTRENPKFSVWKENIHENIYLAELDQVRAGEICLMDRKNITHDGRSKIEFCDLFTKKDELIHVKRYGGSSVLSHLFKQGEVSATLFLGDEEFREKVEEKLTGNFTIHPERKPDSRLYVIWFVIGTLHFKNPNLPLFSKIAFLNTYKILDNMGYKVRIGYVEICK